jgi:hypothetical protein
MATKDLTAKLADTARGAPAAAMGKRPTTTWREDLFTMILAFWPITALMFDGHNHDNKTGQESFFSLAHIFLYVGMSALALWVAIIVTRYQLRAGVNPRQLIPDLKEIPVGYGVAIIGFCVLGVGGPADFAWHSVYGFEIGVDAIYSPPHLMLFFGGLLVSSTGLRSMWAKRDIAPTWARFAPVALSAILFIGVIQFTTMYMSAFMTNISMTDAFHQDIVKNFHDVAANQNIGLVPGIKGFGDNLWPYTYFATGHGVASTIVTTVELLGTILLMMRRWRLPSGAVTVIFIGFALLFNIITAYNDFVILIVPLILAGITIDLLQARLGTGPGGRVTLGGIRVVGTLGALVLWLSYYLVILARDGIGWTTAVTCGAIAVGAIAGFGTAFLIAPPSYGPRLVEGDGEDTVMPEPGTEPTPQPAV